MSMANVVYDYWVYGHGVYSRTLMEEHENKVLYGPIYHPLSVQDPMLGHEMSLRPKHALNKGLRPYEECTVVHP